MATAKNTDTPVEPQQDAPAVALDPEPQQDVRGGRYLVNGNLVDANGKPIEDAPADEDAD